MRGDDVFNLETLDKAIGTAMSVTGATGVTLDGGLVHVVDENGAVRVTMSADQYERMKRNQAQAYANCRILSGRLAEAEGKAK